MQNLIDVSAQNKLTMSSREIATLTGKRHSHILRDIRSKFDQLGDDPNMDHVVVIKDGRGYTSEFQLHKRESLILVSGYSVMLRSKIIDRWQEVEYQLSKNSLHLTDYSAQIEAAEAWADATEAEHKALENLDKARPKREAYEKITSRQGNVSLTIAGKTLSHKPRLFISALVYDKVLYRTG